MKVVCISGKAGHGKDTVAQMIKDKLEECGESVLITHYADLVKYVCTKFFGWNGEKDTKGRALLQKVGTDIVRANDPDFWAHFVQKMLEYFGENWSYVLIPDCRFPNEIDVLKSAGFDVTHLRVVRGEFGSKLTKEQQEHESETALDEYTADAYIHNFGSLEDLKTAAEIFLVNNFSTPVNVKTIWSKF